MAVALTAAVFVTRHTCCGQEEGVGTEIAEEDVDRQREYNVKAVSLYGFSRYASWPQHVFARDDSPFVIGIFGPDHFGGALDHVAAKKTVHGRPLHVKRFDSAANYSTCQVLFVSGMAPDSEVAALIAQLKGKPVLMVGEMPDFANRGGVINFYINNGSVRFHINAAEAQRRGIQLNAKLMTLGTPAKRSSRSVAPATIPRR